jgi:hypothetical protein
MPATGTPEPGGPDWYRTLKLLRRVFAERRVVGVDVVELAPMPGNAAPDFLVAKLIYKMIGYYRGGRAIAADAASRDHRGGRPRRRARYIQWLHGGLGAGPPLLLRYGARGARGARPRRQRASRLINR